MFPMRINKFLTSANFCSRRQADKFISEKKVKINNRIAVLGDKVEKEDLLFVDNKEIVISGHEKIYLAFHKPVGVICTSDKNSPNNIIDYLHYPDRIYPVGRLDVSSSGLILLTNDGELVNKILKAKNKIEKEYLVAVDKSLSESFLASLRSGMKIDGFKTLPAKVEKLSDKTFKIIIIEGKKRQVRRMCERFGLNVTSLIRTRIGSITLDSINKGKYIELSQDQIYKLLNIRA